MIPIDCAVNDDYGSTTNKVEAIHLPGLELVAIDMGGVYFLEVRGFGFYVSRRKWPARHVQSCVGNIYWERYGMDDWSAAAFLRYLRATKLFTSDGGFDELFRWWDSGVDDEAYVRGLLIDAAKDDRS